MSLVTGSPELERLFDAARDADSLEKALTAILDLNGTVGAPDIYGRKLFCEAFDRIIPDVARRMKLAADEIQPRSNDNVCIVATRFYATGGHTGVARDIIRDLPAGKKPALILSQYYGDPVRYEQLMAYPGLQTSLGERSLMLLTSPTVHGRVVELHMMLRSMRPTRIFLLCHPFDVVCVLGTYAFREIVDFIHHADHIPALGATIPYGQHVDLTYTCHLACRAEGLDARYAGLASPEPEIVVESAREPGRLRLATCGLTRKFNTGSTGQRWTDYAVAALRIPGAELHHIGTLTPEMDAEIRAALQAGGIDPARYIVTGVKPLVPELAARNIDVFISSYPVPGGKANLEAMAAGVPMVLPVDSATPPLLRWTLPLPYYVEVNAPADLPGAIDQALAMGTRMQGAEFRALRDREVRRFADYVAGEPLEAA